MNIKKSINERTLHRKNTMDMEIWRKKIGIRQAAVNKGMPKEISMYS